MGGGGPIGDRFGTGKEGINKTVWIILPPRKSKGRLLGDVQIKRGKRGGEDRGGLLLLDQEIGGRNRLDKGKKQPFKETDRTNIDVVLGIGRENQTSSWTKSKVSRV